MTTPRIIQRQEDLAARSRHQLVIGRITRLNKGNLPYTADVEVQDIQGAYTLVDCLIVQPIIWPGAGGVVQFPTDLPVLISSTVVVMTTGGRAEQSSYIIGYLPWSGTAGTLGFVGDPLGEGVVERYDLVGGEWEPVSDDMLPPDTLRPNAGVPALVGSMPTLASDDTWVWLASEPAEQYGLNLAERGAVDHSMPVFVPDPGAANVDANGDIQTTFTDDDGNTHNAHTDANGNVLPSYIDENGDVMPSYAYVDADGNILARVINPTNSNDPFYDANDTDGPFGDRSTYIRINRLLADHPAIRIWHDG